MASGMDEAHADMLQQLMSITGSDDAAVAHSLLEATNWSLEDAVNLHFASGTGGAAAGSAATTSAGPSGSAGFGGGGLVAAGAPDSYGFGDEEQVRAPMPTKRERLYGDHTGRVAGMPGPSSRYGMGGVGRGTEPAPGYVDAFRDFKAEKGPKSANGAGLSELFKPPEGLLYKGTFDAAKDHAAKESRWLLVNVQSGTEFATHQLNRDTWGHSLVQDMVRGMFTFWQVYDKAAEGERVIGMYHLGELPITIIIDPITGAKLWERSGFIPPDALCEQLVPYMDHSPDDPDAWRLAQNITKRKAAPLEKPGARAAPLSEEEQLAMAIEMSMQQGAGDGARSMSDKEEDDGDAGDDDAEEEAAIYRELEKMRAAAAGSDGTGAAGPASTSAAAPAAAAAATPANVQAPEQQARDPEQAQAEAAARLPPEPTDGSGCRVAVRLPDGTRAQRSFSRSDALQVLHDFCITKSSEAAGGRPFQLVVPGPGGGALTANEQTLEAAGVANAMLVMAWSS